jgi:hypothetical protein
MDGRSTLTLMRACKYGTTSGTLTEQATRAANRTRTLAREAGLGRRVRGTQGARRPRATSLREREESGRAGGRRGVGFCFFLEAMAMMAAVGRPSSNSLSYNSSLRPRLGVRCPLKVMGLGFSPLLRERPASSRAPLGGSVGASVRRTRARRAARVTVTAARRYGCEQAAGARDASSSASPPRGATPTPTSRSASARAGVGRSSWLGVGIRVPARRAVVVARASPQQGDRGYQGGTRAGVSRGRGNAGGVDP